jgi:hypothetical protein
LNGGIHGIAGDMEGGKKKDSHCDCQKDGYHKDNKPETQVFQEGFPKIFHANLICFFIAPFCFYFYL